MIWLWEPSTTDQYLQLLDSYPSDAPKLTKWLRKLPQASTLLSHSSTSINKKCFFFLSWINAAFRHVFFCLFLISLHLTNPWKRALHYGLRLKKKRRERPSKCNWWKDIYYDNLRHSFGIFYSICKDSIIYRFNTFAQHWTSRYRCQYLYLSVEFALFCRYYIFSFTYSNLMWKCITVS